MLLLRSSQQKHARTTWEIAKNGPLRRPASYGQLSFPAMDNPGLGLTIVHGTIIDLGGHIWADSIIGQGTTINILLPTNNQ